jgi:hypothetical protein
MQLYKISFHPHLTKKSYIGITRLSALHRLKTGHTKTTKSHIGRAIQKYGVENIILTVLDEGDSWEDLCKKEIAAIAEHNTKYPNGYNLTDGGDGQLQKSDLAGEIIRYSTLKKNKKTYTATIFIKKDGVILHKENMKFSSLHLAKVWTLRKLAESKNNAYY